MGIIKNFDICGTSHQTPMYGLQVAKLFLNPRNLGIPWHSVPFLAVRFRAFQSVSLNWFPSSFSSSHDVLTY